MAKSKHWRWLRPVLFIGGGALAGLAYYRFFGCTTGCAITSSPWRAMLYMALVGWLVSGITKKKGCSGCSI